VSPSDAPVFDRSFLRTPTSLQKLIGKSESRHHSGDKDETDRIAILIGLWAGHASNGKRNISGRSG
jgi:hypothetical protein